MKNHRKIDYYNWCLLEGCYKYVASSNAYRTLREAALRLPGQDKSGALVYTPRVDAARLNLGGRLIRAAKNTILLKGLPL